MDTGRFMTHTVDLNNWSYTKHFLPPAFSGLHPVIEDVEQYIEATNLSSHEFFAIAANSELALKMWLSQELVMTNAFSQVVLAAASRVPNVHVRAVLAEVAYGEHGHVREGLARRAHPWLLHRLADSVNLDPTAVVPYDCTAALISQLAASVEEGTLVAVAWIGVGNERLIIPEYSAIEKCFAAVMAKATYEPFLQANLKEDVLHSRLCYEVASSLITNEDDARRFYNAAVASVRGRCEYFDALADAVRGLSGG